MSDPETLDHEYVFAPPEPLAVVTVVELDVTAAVGLAVVTDPDTEVGLAVAERGVSGLVCLRVILTSTDTGADTPLVTVHL